jgi:predicted flap endonuclease-1-like 5' DNA nuclease
MRTDYVLYVVAVILFIITGIVAVYDVEFKNLWIVGTAVLGLFFAGLGLSQRPKMQSIAVETPPATTVTVQPTMKEEPKKEEAPPVMETPVAIELTQVKGIKAKRAEQLKTLGINNAHDLANASANELAAKLKIASYFTEQWIENAKKLTGKS